MLEQLLSPVTIGSIRLRNRIAMSPMGVEIIDDDGHAREPVIAYYEERARGGAGLVTTEVAAVAYPRGATTARQPGLSDDAYLPGLRELTRRVKSHGARVAVQLVHHGKVARLDTVEGRELLVPSQPTFHGAMDMADDLSRDEIRLLVGASGGAQPKYREASADDIAWVTERFADAALRARRAGFDAVELHAGHGYLLSSFLSPAWNQREDGYGGPVENRARLLCEVIRAAKDRAGADFTLWCRLDAVELRTPGGITFEDAQRTAELAAEAGADAIHVSAYADATSGVGFTEAPLVHREGGFIDYAAGIKARVDVPVIAVGRIEPEVGDRLIRDGKADVISMGRKMLADPAIAAKLAEGRAEDVRPCIYSYTCVAQPFFDRSVRCSVNPVTAHEPELAEVERGRAERPRRVVVAGGGPAGLEAARIAALRGHDVTLFERDERLGGALRLAAMTYEPNGRLLRWLEGQVRDLGVALRLGEPLTPDALTGLAADEVIVAVGARHTRPDVPGSELPHVLDRDDYGTLLADVPAGERFVVVGAELAGIQLAGFLSERGRKVTVLEEGRDLGSAMAHPRRWRVLHELREAGVVLLTRARLVAIDADAVHYAIGDESAEVRADHVVLATGLGENHALADELRAAGARPVVIGDCNGPAYLEGAIRDAFHAAAELGVGGRV